MPIIPHKTQKQISQRYWSNLKFYQHLSPGRKVRFILTWASLFIALFVSIAYFFIAKQYPSLEIFYTTGGISQSHGGFANDCKQCHDPTQPISPLKPVTGHMTSIDMSCQRCHTQHTFHEADVVIDHSCTACHHEHLGSGPMQPVKDSNCLMCHGNADIMHESAEKGAHMPASVFQIAAKDNLIYFQPPRSPESTQAFKSFETDHPDFQIQRDHLIDPNTLKFNHQKHFSSTIPLVDGKKLDCNYCHQVDSHGAYMQSMTFSKNCQACHSLQIEPTMPADFQVPHPASHAGIGAARDFLLTLPTQYANYAVQKMGMTQTADIDAFVNKHMAVVRQQAPDSNALVDQVFLGDAHRVQFQNVAGQTNRALFPGCAYCHEVKPGAVGTSTGPIVTPPVTPDRWLVRAQFNHSAHTTVSCESCHNQIRTSSKTADINIPDKASCVTCHSAKGGIASTCVTCHGYHNEDTTTHGTANTTPLRAMMFGTR